MIVATRLPGPKRRAMPIDGKDIRARARSCQHAFDRRQFLHHVEGIVIVDRDDLVGERQIAGLRG